MRSRPDAMMMRTLLILALLSLGACQTVKGVAADVKNGTDTVVGWMGG